MIIFYNAGGIILGCKNNNNQLHAVSRTQQGRQREPGVKTLHPPLSAVFWRRGVLSGGNLKSRRVLPRHQREEMKILINISFPRVGIEPTTSRFYSHTLCSCTTTGLKL